MTNSIFISDADVIAHYLNKYPRYMLMRKYDTQKKDLESKQNVIIYEALDTWLITILKREEYCDFYTKEYWFIQWLIDNDYIYNEKVEKVIYKQIDWWLTYHSLLNSIIMQLSIVDDKVSYLSNILKPINTEDNEELWVDMKTIDMEVPF